LALELACRPVDVRSVRTRGKEHVEELERNLGAARRRIAELERALETNSLRDPLTGLPTVQAFGPRLELEVERYRRHGRALAVAVLDVDNFAAINASHGRQAGDAVLQAVAQALRQHTRATDIITRSSADEFIVALPEATATEATQAFERLLLELEAKQVGPLESISASIGIAEYSGRMTTDELIGAATEHMRRARGAGGGRAKASPSPVQTLEEAGQSAAHEDAVSGLAEALAERDRYTGEHSQEVLELVEQVARGLALDEQEVQRVRYAALLHDIGKVAIPDEILHKPGPLDHSEWEIMRQHPVIGERILRAIPGLGGVARIVRHEHESYDGSGYPDGLSGDEIPIGARIILACDAYHAMVSDRPYRQALSHAEAVRELAKNAGKQFDPQVTEVLIGALYASRQSGPRVSAAA
jgi:diguanylate cyclase (GGDEF)-like protein/putative nucleotidyltransferase with HDIG domain